MSASHPVSQGQSHGFDSRFGKPKLHIAPGVSVGMKLMFGLQLEPGAIGFRMAPTLVSPCFATILAIVAHVAAPIAIVASDIAPVAANVARVGPYLSTIGAQLLL